MHFYYIIAPVQSKEANTGQEMSLGWLTDCTRAKWKIMYNRFFLPNCSFSYKDLAQKFGKTYSNRTSADCSLLSLCLGKWQRGHEWTQMEVECRVTLWAAPGEPPKPLKSHHDLHSMVETFWRLAVVPREHKRREGKSVHRGADWYMVKFNASSRLV